MGTELNILYIDAVCRALRGTVLKSSDGYHWQFLNVDGKDTFCEWWINNDNTWELEIYSPNENGTHDVTNTISGKWYK